VKLSILDQFRGERPELSLEQRRSRGEEVERMLAADSVFRDVMNEVELQTLEVWRDSVEADVRDRSWAVVNALTEVQRVLHKIMDDGAVAAQLIREGEELRPTQW
jgi:hypothetical protein